MDYAPHKEVGRGIGYQSTKMAVCAFKSGLAGDW